MRALLQFVKPLIAAFIIVAVLQVTGLFGEVAYVTQRAALSTGLMNADIREPVGKMEDFDYSFMLKDSLGNRIPAEKLKGKVIFLNLWATWCGPCRAEMPAIQKLYNKVKDDRVAFVMLSIDRDNAAQKVKDYIYKKSFTFPVYLPSGYLTEQLNVPSIPTTFVISKEGKVVMKEVGTKNYNTDKFLKFLNELAGE